MNNKCYICYKDNFTDNLIYHPKCSKRVFGSETAPEMPYRLDEMKKLARKIVQSQSVITGVQPKISMGIEKANKQLGKLSLMSGDYILKPPSDTYNQLPENEDLTMSLAAMAGIETVPHALIPLKSGELAYITKRVDRSVNGKIHMEDFCQLSGLATAEKYKSSLERVGRTMATFSSNFGLDLFNLFALILFCFISSNNDMHLKNFSLIKKDKWVMAPGYDLLNVTLALPTDIEETALTIVGRKRKLTKENFLALGESYRLSTKQIDNSLSMICEPDYHGLIQRSFLNADNKKQYSELIDMRRGILMP